MTNSLSEISSFPGQDAVSPSYEAKSEKLILTYKYKLLPTKAQHKALAQILEDQRLLYNAALAERIDAYKRSLLEVERGLRAKPHTITFFDQANSLTVCRQDPLIGAEMSRYPVPLQRWTLARLDDAYRAFFKRVKAGKGPAGFPKFRNRDQWRSFGFSQNGGFRLGGNRCKVGFNGLPGYDGRKLTEAGNIPGGIRIHLHRPLPGDIQTVGHQSKAVRTITLTRSSCGRKWYISIVCEVDKQHRCQSKNAAIGIDLGVSTAIAQSDGCLIPGPHPGRKMRGAERRAARALARARKGSKRRRLAKRRLAVVKAKMAAIRHHWQHVQAARLTRCYAIIAAEDLIVSNMTKSAAGTIDKPSRNVKAKSGLNREILDTAPASLLSKLAYKANRDGARLVLVDPKFTSQTCSACGALVPKNLSQRTHHCTECGLVLDRDENAAKNILKKAFSLLSENIGVPPNEDATKVANGAGRRRRPKNTISEKKSDGGCLYSQKSIFDNHRCPDNHSRKELILKRNSFQSIQG